MQISAGKAIFIALLALIVANWRRILSVIVIGILMYVLYTIYSSIGAALQPPPAAQQSSISLTQPFQRVDYHQEDGGDAIAIASAQGVIARQLDAFSRGDGEGAFAYASPKVKSRFASVDAFMTMVVNGYAPIYRHETYSFGRSFLTAEGGVEQVVMLVGNDGRAYEAVYSVVRASEGATTVSWVIDGVLLRQQPGTDL